MLAFILSSLLLVQQGQAPPPAQRPAEITITVEEYARLKTCEQVEQQRQMKRKRIPSWAIALGLGVAVAIAAIAKKK